MIGQFIANELNKRAKQQASLSKLTQMAVNFAAILGGEDVKGSLKALKPQIEQTYGKGSYDTVEQAVMSANFFARMGLGGRGMKPPAQAAAQQPRQPEDFDPLSRGPSELPVKAPTAQAPQRGLPAPKTRRIKPSISPAGLSVTFEDVENPEYAEERTARLHQLNDIFLQKQRDNPDKTGTSEGNLALWEDTLDEFSETYHFYPNAEELEAYTPPEIKGMMQASQDKYVKEAEVAGKLRTEFSQDSNDFVKVRDSYDRILATGAKRPSAAGDLALIFNYMKMLDPGSVVRESEFATAQNAAGVSERVRAFWNRMLRGERLTPAMRADFLAKAAELYKAAKRGQQRLVENYKRLAEVNLVDPRRVIIDYTYEMGGPTLPEGVPPGSFIKGKDRQTGKNIWQAPDGELYMED